MNSSLPEIHVSRIGCWGRYVWFRSSVRKPSEEELAGWIVRYREEALTHDPGERLVVDVERDGLRRALRFSTNLEFLDCRATGGTESVALNPAMKEVA